MSIFSGKRLLGIPERPLSLPNTKTIRLEQQDDGTYVPVDVAACGLQMQRMVHGDLQQPGGPIDLDVIAQIEQQRMINKVRGGKNKRDIMKNGARRTGIDSRIVSLKSGGFVRINVEANHDNQQQEYVEAKHED